MYLEFTLFNSLEVMQKIGLKDFSMKDYVDLAQSQQLCAALSRIYDFSKFLDQGQSEVQGMTEELVCFSIFSSCNLTF